MDNTDWSKIRPTNQDEFIYYSIYKFKQSKYKVYFDNQNGKWIPSHWTYSKENRTSVENLYYEGFFVLKLLKCSFEDFFLAITQQKGVHPWENHIKERNENRRGYWFKIHNNVEFRQPIKFQQNKIKKKEKNTIKSDWRSKKGFTKDFRKNEKGLHKTFAKKSSNKEFRRMEKQKIQVGKHEELFWGIRKDYFDPWDWD